MRGTHNRGNTEGKESICAISSEGVFLEMSQEHAIAMQVLGSADRGNVC